MLGHSPYINHGLYEGLGFNLVCKQPYLSQEVLLSKSVTFLM